MGCPPAPVYKGAREGGGRTRRRARQGGSPTPTGSRTPPFLVGVGKGKGEGKRGGRHPLPSPIQTRHGGARPPLEALLSFPVWPIKAHYFPRGILVTPRYSEKYPNHSEPFRCPNIVVQYIDLYVSTISRFLVKSLISSGTPNSFGTSKHINS